MKLKDILESAYKLDVQTVAEDIMPLLNNRHSTTNAEINRIIDEELGLKLSKDQRLKVMRFMNKYYNIKIAI